MELFSILVRPFKRDILSCMIFNFNVMRRGRPGFGRTHRGSRSSYARNRLALHDYISFGSLLRATNIHEMGAVEQTA